MLILLEVFEYVTFDLGSGRDIYSSSNGKYPEHLNMFDTRGIDFKSSQVCALRAAFVAGGGLAAGVRVDASAASLFAKPDGRKLLSMTHLDIP